MKLHVEIETITQWAGPTSDGEPFVLTAGAHDINTKDKVLITALRDAHWAYRMHGVGVVVTSDDPAWAKLLAEAEEREAFDRETDELLSEALVVESVGIEDEETDD